MAKRRMRQSVAGERASLDKKPPLNKQPWTDPKTEQDELDRTPRALTRDPEIEQPPATFEAESVNSRQGNLPGFEGGTGKG
jgi:hypothetical protein